MKKFLLLLMFALFCIPWAANAQSTVTIGDLESASNNTYLPMNSVYDYSYTQQIYTADEIGMAGTITSITMWLYGNANLYEMPFDIYILEVEKENFVSTTDWVPVTAADLVYSGSVTVHNTDAQAYTFTLDVPFVYSGTSNLLICFNNKTGQWKGGLTGKVFGAAGDPVRAIYARRDSYIYNPYDMSGISAYSTSTQRNVVELEITPNSGPTCERPFNFAPSIVTAHSATFTWESEVGNYVFEYKKASEDGWTVRPIINENTCELPDLDANTAYNARVKAVCGTELESGYRTTNFTTPIACPAPTGLAAALTPGNGAVATLSWTPGGSETEWELEYSMDETFTTDVFVESNLDATAFYLDGLTPEATYYARVKALCGGEYNDESEYSDVISFTPTDAYTITVYDGTATNGYVPIYGYYCDNYTRGQFIIPASDLSDMQWGTINELTFYASQSSVGWGAAQFEVYMTETSETTLSALADWSTMEKVMNAGTLSISGNKMVVTLDAPYQYMGGNLLIGFYQTVSGSWSSSSWYGVSAASGASYGGYGSSVNAQFFLPKTTFAYTPGEEPACLKPTGVTASEVTGHEATITWTSDAAAWEVQLNEEDPVEVTTATYTFPDLIAETQYTVKVRANCGGSYSDWTAGTNFTTGIVCPAPTGLAAALTPGDGTVATLSWTPGGSETEWELEYSTDETFNTGVTELYDLDATTVALDELTPEATYYARVKALCGGEYNDESQYSDVFSFTPTDAYIITVNDGTTTNGYVPIYGYYCDDYTRGQFIIPASDLSYMQWGTINELTFYASQSSVSWGSAQFEVYMTETSETTLSALADWSTMEKVMNAGTLSISGNKMVVTLDAPYQYMGGNLLIGFYQTVSGSWSSSSWYGVSAASGASYGGYGSSVNAQFFLPKTTFAYTPGEAPACFKPTGVTASEITAHGASISWTAGGNEQAWQILLSDGEQEEIIDGIESTEYDFNDLDPETQYTVKVRANCSEEEQSEWSTSVTFTTPESCPEPTELTVNEVSITATGATVSWTGGENANVRYRVAAQESAIFSEDFESGLDQWTILHGEDATAPSGGYWYTINPIGGLAFEAHSGSYCASSWSWNNSALQADNYLVTPQVALGGTLRFWVRTNATYPDSYEVLLSQTGNAIDDFNETLQALAPAPDNGEWNEVTIDLSSYTGNGYIAIHHQDYDMNYLLIDDFGIYVATTPAGEWTELTNVAAPTSIDDLTANTTYEVQAQASCEEETSDWTSIVTFTTSSSCPAPTDLTAAEPVGATSVELSWTENGEATVWVVAYKASGDDDYTEENVNENPYDLDNLTPETEYTVKVRPLCENEEVEKWSDEITFVTGVACPAPTDVAANDVTATEANISWNGEANSYDLRYAVLPEETESIYYDDGNYSTNIGTGSNVSFYWGIMLPAGTYSYDQLTSVSLYDGGYDMTGTITVYNGGTNTPISPVGSTDIALTGVYDFVEFALPASVDPSKNLWIVVYNENGATYPAAACSGQVDPNGSWISMDGSNWETLGSDLDYMWMLRANFAEISESEWTTSENTDLTGLEPGTTYVVKVKADCGDYESVWSSASFTTPESCPAPTDLTLDEESVTAHEASISWTANGTEETWQILLNDDDPIDVTSTEYDFTGLDAATEYTVQVRAYCSEEEQSDWSDPVTFTTVNPCETPVLTVTQNSDNVEISWTGAAESWSLWFDDYTGWMEYDNQYTIYPAEGYFAEGSTHTVKVQATCVEAVSEWSNEETFTMPYLCPAPEDVTVTLTEGNGTEATLNWTESGNATSWVLEYGEDVEFVGATSESVMGTPEITLTGLTAGTTYYARVKAVCDAESESIWSEMINFTPSNAVSLTVHDGTVTNGYVPVYGFYADAYLKAEFVIPAEELADMAYGTISDMTFYASQQSVNWGTASFQVFLTEVCEPTISEYAGPGNVVYEGSLSIVDNKMHIEFTTPYEYQGGNLLVGVYSTATGSYVTSSWYGESVDGASVQGYSYSGLAYATLYQRNFIPKTTFKYIPSEVSACLPPTNLQYSDETATTVTLSWTEVGTATQWKLVNGERTVIATTNPYTLTDLTPATEQTWTVQAICAGEESELNNCSSVTFTTEPSCFKPTSATAENVTATGATLTWVRDTRNIGEETYSILDENDALVAGGLSGTSYTFQLPLTPNTPYTFKIRTDCANADETVDVVTVNFTTLETCPTPTDLAAALTEGDGTVATLSWTETGSSTNWVLEYGVDAEFVGATSVDVNVNPIELTNLIAETTYYARVKAVCSAGNESDWSNVITFTPTNATTLTVYDGSATSSYVPVYGFYADAYLKAEFVIPAEELADMAYGTISDMTFYASQASVDWGAASFQVFLTEVCADTISAYVGPGNVVYEGSLSIVDNKMHVEFTTPYEYQGGNLLVGVYNTVTGSYVSSSWYGATVSGASVQGYDYNSLASVSLYQRNFIPKTTFKYIPGEVPACLPPANLTVDGESITARTATLSWTEKGTATQWKLVNGERTVVATTNPYTLTGLTPETTQTWTVQAICAGEESEPNNCSSVTFTTAVACPVPTNLAKSDEGFTAHNVTLSWTRGNEDAWQLCVDDDEDHLIDVTENPYTLTGLDPETDYTVKVRANCGGEDGVSEWSSKLSFTTPEACPAPTELLVSDVEATTATVSWTGNGVTENYVVYYKSAGKLSYIINEGFEDEQLPEGWTNEGNAVWTVGTGDYYTSTGTYSGNYNAKITHTSNGNETYLVTPAVNLNGKDDLNLNMAYINRSWLGDTDGFGVYYRIGDGEWNEMLATTTTAHSSWTPLSLSLPAGAYADNCQFGFKMTDNYGYGVGLDSVIMIGFSGGESEWHTVTVTGTTTELTDLIPGATYEVKVQADCGEEDGESLFSETVSFTTKCMTYNETMDISECNSYTWIDGITYDESNNTATYMMESQMGCDSIIHLNLTINHPTEATFEKTVCENIMPYTWYDSLFTEAGTKTFTIQNAAGCDSVVTLILHTQECETDCGIVEVDGSSYNTVVVHSLCWMTSNLRSTNYTNGNEIPFAIVYSDPATGTTADSQVFGRLYRWGTEAKALVEPLDNICPEGWRIPSRADYEDLYSAYSDGQLRSITNWIQNAGTNESGFDMQPAGLYSGATSRCERLGASACLYTSDMEGSGIVYLFSDYGCDEPRFKVSYNPMDAFSIRCVREITTVEP